MPHRNHIRNQKKKNINLPAPGRGPAIGETLDAEVFKITDFGAFVKISGNRLGLIHISQIADDYVKKVADHLKVGDRVTARVVQVRDDGKIDLTLKTAKEQMNSYPRDREFRHNIFEEKINSFLQREDKPRLKVGAQSAEVKPKS
jgi:S1 RNA binding domain protein